MMPTSMALGKFSTFDISVLVTSVSFTSYLAFKRYEPETFLPLLTLLVGVPGLLAVPVSAILSSQVAGTAVAFAAYGSLIMLFTLIYRLSPWHPLAKYPGPLPSRITKWWSVFVCSKGKQYLYYRSLHERYGDVVRVGPNELSIRDPSIIPAVLGPGGLSKGPFWDHRTNPPSLVMERDAEAHARRRRPWNRAFTSAALKDYEFIINKRSKELVECFEGMIKDQSVNEKEKKALVDVSAWMSFFSTDFMGDMAFGGSFQLMKDAGDAKGLWHIFEAGLEASTLLGHVPWMLVFLNRLPGSSRTIQRMRKFARDNVAERLKMGSNRKDLFYHLSGEEGPESGRLSPVVLASEGTLAIIAGSDTAGTTLSAIFYFLITHLEVYKHLQDEIDREFSYGEEALDTIKLSRMEWLNGIINEALRLHPPVPGGSQRSVVRGMGAKTFGTYVIPEETQLFIHTYSVQRDARNFYSPDLFLPERWFGKTDSEHLVHNPDAFLPFSYGPTSCAGKNLSLLEMRTLVTTFMQKFDFRAAEGTNPNDFADNLLDFFVFRKGELWIEVIPRV